MIRRRDDWLEVSRYKGRDLAPPDAPRTVRDRRRGWLKQLSLVHVALVPLLGSVWRYSAYLWPTWLLPAGIAIGAPHQVHGMLNVSANGQAALFVNGQRLKTDYIDWVENDDRPPPARCLALTPRVAQRLSQAWASTRDVPRHGQFWATIEVQPRVGPDQCGRTSAIGRIGGIAAITALRPVECSRAVFVANGFACPALDRAAPQSSPPLAGSDYYPAAALRAGDEGRVTVRVQRDATGSPTACAVLTSSGHAILDHQACKLVGTDPTFTHPGDGPPNTPITQSVNWKLSE